MTNESPSLPSGSQPTTRFLLARLPSNQVPAFLRVLHACGMDVHPDDELSDLPSATGRQSTVMAWMQCHPRVHERWLKDPRVLGFREGVPYGMPS